MTYKVFWQTKVGVGCTYYSGVETVQIEEGEEEDVREIAINNVWHRGFRDLSRNHIQVTSVEAV